MTSAQFFIGDPQRVEVLVYIELSLWNDCTKQMMRFIITLTENRYNPFTAIYQTKKLLKTDQRAYG